MMTVKQFLTNSDRKVALETLYRHLKKLEIYPCGTTKTEGDRPLGNRPVYLYKESDLAKALNNIRTVIGGPIGKRVKK